ncbi:hypothetical protein [Methanobrevibacter arboriphilus]|nr:hypothetical protein [Methanobrevibacter arboriphilus]
MIATIINAVLDFVFTAIFGWGMFGIGVATTIGYFFCSNFLVNSFLF